MLPALPALRALPQALSVEEARERQNRLAKMRALLFYHELKAKRMKKIKSKVGRPPAFLCPTGQIYLGLCSAPHSTLQKVGR